MRYVCILAVTLVQLAVMTVDADAQSPVAADVAVATFTVADDGDGVLRAAADSCLERLVRGLKDKGIAVARHPQLSEKTLKSAKPAPLAVIGHLSREKGLIQAELRLLEVESGEEMRTYFNSDKDPGLIADLGMAASARIAALVQERKGAPPSH